MRCYLDSSDIDVVVYDILCRVGESKKDALVDMGVAFGWSVPWFLYGDWGPKSSHVFKIWLVSSPSFVGHLLYCRMVCAVKDVARVHKCVAPE